MLLQMWAWPGVVVPVCKTRGKYARIQTSRIAQRNVHLFSIPNTNTQQHITTRAHARRPRLCSTRAVSEPVACARTAAQRACMRSHGSALISMDFNSGARLQQLHDVLRASWAWIYASLPCCNDIRCTKSASFPKSAGQRLVKKTCTPSRISDSRGTPRWSATT